MLGAFIYVLAQDFVYAWKPSLLKLAKKETDLSAVLSFFIVRCSNIISLEFVRMQ